VCQISLSESACIENGCQVIKGSRCSSSSAAPPCDLSFNNENNKECCDSDQTDEHIHYLGCMQPGYVCMLQCMEYVPTGTLYIVWEGCATDGDDWIDVSNSGSCDACFEKICPNQVTDGWVAWVIWIVVLLLATAFVLVICMAVFALASFLRWKYNFQRGELYSKLVSVFDPAAEETQTTELESVQPQTQPQPQAPTGRNTQVPVIRRADGNVAIQMADGSVRVVTPEQYQKLYYFQNVKRARMLQMQRQKQQQQQQAQQAQNIRSGSAPSVNSG